MPFSEWMPIPNRCIFRGDAYSRRTAQGLFTSNGSMLRDIKVGFIRTSQGFGASSLAIFKKGDASQPGNYHPIAVLPVLYKLYARVLLSRIKNTWDSL